MCDPNLRARCCQLDLEFFLQVGAGMQLLSLRRKANGVIVLRYRNRSVVGIISSLHFRRNPQAVAAVQAELGTAGLARIFRDFMKLVLAIAKAVEENPRTDVRGHNQFDDPVRQLVGIVPAPV